MKKKIIIAGGTGFLGFHFAKACLKKKWIVVSVSRKKPKKKRFLKDVKYIQADITDKENLQKKLKGHMNAVFLINFAGEAEHKNIKKTFLSHYRGLKNLSELFSNKFLIKFIQIGTSFEYGKIKSPHREHFKLQPISNYAKAKTLASKELLNNYKKNNFSALIVRPYQIYGPNQDLNRFIPRLISNCIKNKIFPCTSGVQFRDFLFIDDFINFIEKIIINKKLKNEVFNIGYGKPKKIKNIILLVKRLIGQGGPVIGKVKMRNEESITSYPDISKAFKLTGWRPKVRFNSGLKKTINYYQKN